MKPGRQEPVEKRKSVCHWCKGRCGVVVDIKGDRLVKVEIDKEFPGGAMGTGCRRLRPKSAAEWFYARDRLNYPLKRGGRRGENKWQRITWDQALDEIADELSGLRQRYGPETLLVTSGDSWTCDEYKTRFMSLFGTANLIGPSMICGGPRHHVAEAIYGWPSTHSMKPHATKCVIALGCNIPWGRPALWVSVQEAMRNGAKLIAIDPRRTETAHRAHVWLQLKPGTDAALLLGMINYLIQKELYDKEFVAQWCYGFDKLTERVAQYPLNRVEMITGVREGDIRRAADMYWANRPAAIIEGMGVEQQTNSAQSIHARCVLAAITGNLDVEGGDELAGAHTSIVTDRQIEFLQALGPEQRRRMVAADRFKLHIWPGLELLEKAIAPVMGEFGGAHWYLGQTHQGAVYNQILSEQPYPIKAAISTASSPLVSHANTGQVYAALHKLDLYVMMDLFMNPSAQLADYVLPAASWLERPELYSLLGYGTTIIANKAVLPSQTAEYDRRNDFDFWRGLGIRLGQAEFWPWQTLEESYEERLKPLGMSFDQVATIGLMKDLKQEFMKYERIGFGTPTGKVELYSTIFEKLGYDPLPYYEPPAESKERKPDLAARFPLILIQGARKYEFFHSQWRQVKRAREIHPDPVVEIHPDTARTLGIQDGDWVWIETRLGRVRQRCQYFDGLHPDVVHADAQWWYPELPGEEPWLYGVWMSNINAILPNDPEESNPVVGSWPLRAVICRIYK